MQFIPNPNAGDVLNVLIEPLFYNLQGEEMRAEGGVLPMKAGASLMSEREVIGKLALLGSRFAPDGETREQLSRFVIQLQRSDMTVISGETASLLMDQLTLAAKLSRKPHLHADYLPFAAGILRAVEAHANATSQTSAEVAQAKGRSFFERLAGLVSRRSS